MYGRDPGGVGGPRYRCGACPPGSLDHCISFWNLERIKNVSHTIRFPTLVWCKSALHGIRSTIAIRSPIHRMTGTAIELPNARYRGPSAAGFLRYSTSV